MFATWLVSPILCYERLIMLLYHLLKIIFSICTAVHKIIYVHMSYICMYLYNYLLFIPSVHIFINIYVQKVLIGTSWWYIATYLRRCIRTLVQKIEWTSILFYIKSCRYGIISIVIFWKETHLAKIHVFHF